jgi:uncharacterized coiled-coil protein SlyX
MQSAQDGVAHYEIRTAEDRDVREELGQALAGKHWNIRRLERKSRRLEDAFFDVLRVQDPLNAPPSDEPKQSAPPSTDIQASPSADIQAPSSPV